MTINSTASMLMQRPRMLLVGDNGTEKSLCNVADAKFLAIVAKIPQLTVRT
jgi:hypothetical protein